MESINGYIERITFQSIENGFTVAKLKASGHQQLVCLVGTMPALQPGETISAHGQWKINPQHGQQFEVERYQVKTPSDLLGMQKYLESGLIRGIGSVYAERIVKKFGLDTLRVIDTEHEKLCEVSGIGKKRLEQIKTCWDEQKTVRDVMIFLQSYGISPAFAQKIFKAYRKNSMQKLEENPYNLCRDIKGIGFKIADKIAKKMGLNHDSEQRIDAGIEFVLSELSGDGHVCYPLCEFFPIAQEMLDVPSSCIESRIETLELQDRVVTAHVLFEGEKKKFIWLKVLYVCEMGIAKEVLRLRTAATALRRIDHEKAIAWVQEQIKIQLAPLQTQAIAAALQEKFLIITGGPGTGKSTIIDAILQIISHLSNRILLAAPTGRAAKRMTEITKREAKTIHSLLEFDFRERGFKRNRDNPLVCDLIIIDEASMIDTYLMYSLLKAIPNESRVVFVGDVNQLPSVGPGNVLKEMILSMRLEVTMLTEIFRQASTSQITTNAHKINQGHFPNIQNDPDSDFYFIQRDEKEDVLDCILNLISTRLPKRYGLKPFEDIQLLTPMKRGLLGTENLNQVLQKVLNPKEGGLMRGGYFYRPGDKVMQIRNNYKKEVFNGDMGRILSIDEDLKEVIVEIDRREVSYDFYELDELMLAYAISVHKFQGSECPCIIMPVHLSHFKLLHRNLLYTGVTRGKRLVILVGSKKALAIAIKNNEVKHRYTTLQHALLNMSTLGNTL